MKVLKKMFRLAPKFDDYLNLEHYTDDMIKRFVYLIEKLVKYLTIYQTQPKGSNRIHKRVQKISLVAHNLSKDIINIKSDFHLSQEKVFVFKTIFKKRAGGKFEITKQIIKQQEKQIPHEFMTRRETLKNNINKALEKIGTGGCAPNEILSSKLEEAIFDEYWDAFDNYVKFAQTIIKKCMFLPIMIENYYSGLLTCEKIIERVSSLQKSELEEMKKNVPLVLNIFPMEKNEDMVTEIFTCGKCDESKCNYSKALKTGDTCITIITCTKCGNQWNFPLPKSVYDLLDDE